MKKLIFLFFILSTTITVAQRGIGTNTPNPNSVLHLESADSSQGLIIPKVTTVNRPVAAQAIKGMMIFNVTDTVFQICDGVTWRDIRFSQLIDDDGDTKVDVEEINDEDYIRFDVAGKQAMIIDSTKRVTFFPNNMNNNSSFYFTGIHTDGRWGMFNDNGYQLLTGRWGVNVVGLGVGEYNSGVTNAGVGVINGIAHIPRIQVAGGQTGPFNRSFLSIDRSSNTEWNTAALYPNGANYYEIRTGLTTPNPSTNRRAPLQISAFDLKFFTDTVQTERMRITSDGNIGINTTSPQKILHIDAANDSLQFENLAGTGSILGIDANGKVFVTDTVQNAFNLSDSDGDTKIQVEESPDDDHIRFDTRGVERMIIDTLGNIGIGTGSIYSPPAGSELMIFEKTLGTLYGGRNITQSTASYNLIWGNNLNAAGSEFSAIFGANNSASSRGNLVSGENNTMSGNAGWNLVAGRNNTIAANRDYNFIAGEGNTTTGASNFIFGTNNTTGGNNNSIVGGINMQIGGNRNLIGTGDNHSMNGVNSAIIAGQDHVMGGNLMSVNSVIVAGNNNTIGRQDTGVVILTGSNNFSGSNGGAARTKNGVIITGDNNRIGNATLPAVKNNVIITGENIIPTTKKNNMAYTSYLSLWNSPNQLNSVANILTRDTNDDGEIKEITIANLASQIEDSINLIIQDDDGDTKIQVEENPDDDHIRFDTRNQERMVIDSLGNVKISRRLGINIGGFTPSESLELNGNIRLRGASTIYTGGNNKILIGDINDTISLKDILYTHTNRVGINTASPQKILHIDAANDSLQFENLAGTGSILGIDANGKVFVTDTVQNAFNLSDSDGDTKIQVEESPDDDHIRFDTRGAQRMVIDTNGYVGIGTNTPLTNVYIDGGSQNFLTMVSRNNQAILMENYNVSPNNTLRFMSATGNPTTPGALQDNDVIGRIQFQGHDGTSFRQAAEITGQSDGAIGSGDMPGLLIFKTSLDGTATAQERMRITNEGYIGIGTSAPRYDVEIQTSASKITYMTDEGGGFDGQKLVLKSFSDSTYLYDSDGDDSGGVLSNRADLRFTNQSSGTSISLNGNIVMTGDVIPVSDNSYSLGTGALRWTEVFATNGTINTSDERLKTNIEPLHYGLSDVLKLKTVTYNWKENDNGTRIGFLAQDLQNSIPEVVTKANDTAQTLGVRYTEMIPVLTKAIQEQQEIIDQLKLENEILKNTELKQNLEINNYKAENSKTNEKLLKLENELEVIKLLIIQKQEQSKN